MSMGARLISLYPDFIVSFLQSYRNSGHSPKFLMILDDKWGPGPDTLDKTAVMNSLVEYVRSSANIDGEMMQGSCLEGDGGSDDDDGGESGVFNPGRHKGVRFQLGAAECSVEQVERP